MAETEGGAGGGDIASLALAVDARAAVGATDALDRLAAAALRAEGAVLRMAAAADTFREFQQTSAATTQAVEKVATATDLAAAAGRRMQQQWRELAAQGAEVSRQLDVANKLSAFAGAANTAEAAAARVAAGWRALGVAGTEVMRTLDISRRMSEAVTAMDTAEAASARLAAGWRNLSAAGAEVARGLDVTRRMSEFAGAANTAAAAAARLASGWSALGAAGAEVMRTLDIANRLSAFSAAANAAENASERLERQWQSLSMAGRQMAQGLDVANRMSQNFGVAGANGARMMSDGTRQAAENARNLGFQLNDIAVSLASGQSPAVVFMQQGMQIAQVIDGPGGIRGALSSLGSGIMTMLTNPINLAVMGFAALTGAVTLLWNSVSEGKTVEDVLKNHEKIIKEVASAYGEAGDAAEAYARRSKAAMQADATFNREDIEGAIQGQIKGGVFDYSMLNDIYRTFSTAEYMDLSRGDFKQVPPYVIESYKPFAQAIQNLRETIRAGKPDIVTFNDEVGRMSTDPRASEQTRQLARELFELTREAAEAQRALGPAAGAVTKLGDMAWTTRDRLKELKEFLKDTGGEDERLKKIREIEQAYTKTITEIERLARSGQLPSRMEEELMRRATERRDDDIRRVDQPVPIPREGGNPFREESYEDPFMKMMEGAALTRRALQEEIAEVGIGGQALATYRREKELLMEAERQHIPLTEERIQQIREEAAAYGAVAAELEKRRDAFKDNQSYMQIITSANERLEQLRMERELYGQNAEAIARAKYEHQLLNQAVKAGIDLNPDVVAGLQQKAQELAEAEVATKGAKEGFDMLGQGIEAAFSGGEDAIKKFIIQLLIAAAKGALLGEGPLANFMAWMMGGFKPAPTVGGSAASSASAASSPSLGPSAPTTSVERAPLPPLPPAGAPAGAPGGAPATTPSGVPLPPARAPSGAPPAGPGGVPLPSVNPGQAWPPIEVKPLPPIPRPAPEIMPGAGSAIAALGNTGAAGAKTIYETLGLRFPGDISKMTFGGMQPSGNMADILTRAAKSQGITPEDFGTMARIESGFDPNAKNGQHVGLFQFSRDTGRAYGLRGPGFDNRTDPEASAFAGARLWADNRRALRSEFGTEPESWQMYLAHQQGIGGATALLRNPDANAVDTLNTLRTYSSRPGLAQRAVVGNGGTADMTSGEFANLWKDKWEKFSPPGAWYEQAASKGLSMLPSGQTMDAALQGIPMMGGQGFAGGNLLGQLGNLAPLGGQLTGTVQNFLGQFNTGLNTLSSGIAQTGGGFLGSFGGALQSIVGGLAGGAGGGGGGIFGTIFSLIGGIFGNADGGRVYGAGGPREDKVLTKVSPGEWIVNARSAGKYDTLLAAINSGNDEAVARAASRGGVQKREDEHRDFFEAGDLGRAAARMSKVPQRHGSSSAASSRLKVTGTTPTLVGGGAAASPSSITFGDTTVNVSGGQRGSNDMSSVAFRRKLKKEVYEAIEQRIDEDWRGKGAV